MEEANISSEKVALMLAAGPTSCPLRGTVLVTFGALLSILIGPKVAAAAVFPALSAQVPLKVAVIPLVSVVKVCTSFPEAEVRLLPPVSAHVNVTRTSLFVHV